MLFEDTVFGILRRERLECARRLLNEKGKNITEIAYLCGFSSPSHLTKAFPPNSGSPQSNTRLPGGTGTLPLPFHAASSIHEPTLPISDLPYTLYWIFVGFPACKAPLPIPLFRRKRDFRKRKRRSGLHDGIASVSHPQRSP